MGQKRLAEYLTCAAGRGELAMDDVAFAAEQFLELCKVRLWARAVFGIQDDFTAEEIDEVVGHAVDMFLARYGV